MALIMAEGFTFLPQNPTKNDDRTTTPLTKLGWEVGDTANASVTETFTKFNVLPDEVFPDRNVLKIGAIAASSAARGAFIRYRVPDDKVPDTLLVGYVVRYVLSSVTARVSFYPAFGTINMEKVTTASGTIKDLDEGLWLFTASGSAGGSALPNPNGTLGVVAPWDKVGGYQNFYFESGRDYHVECLIERDTGRLRMYVDGQLISDYTYAGKSQEDLTKGFTFWQGGSNTPNGCYGLYSNIYALGIDDTHTGPLGPATRVLEVLPEADIAVEFSRNEKLFDSNAAVLRQDLANSNGYLSGGEEGQQDILSIQTDLIKMNAAQIYGIQIKISAGNYDTDPHDVGVMVGSNGNMSEPDSHPLQPLEGKLLTRDISKNPDTGAFWTPSDVTQMTIGYKINN